MKDAGRKVAGGGRNRHFRLEGPGFKPVEKMSALPPDAVRPGGIIGEYINKTVENNLLRIDADNDFLKPFREKHPGPGKYTGMGKLVCAATNFARRLKDPGVAAFKTRLVEELIKTGEKDGYIGTFKPDMRVKTLWDVHEMSYVIQGLVSDYFLFGSNSSLKSARSAGNYLIKNSRKIPLESTISPSLVMLGMDKAFLMLSEALGDGRYINFARAKTGLDKRGAEIVLGRHGRVEGHAYAHMAGCLAQLGLYRGTGEPKLAGNSKNLLNFLVSGEGMLITGAVGQEECWHNTQDGSKKTGETCASAYSLRLLDEFLRSEGRPVYGDIMERIIYNTLFAAQSPCGRHIRYYTPLEGKRSYWEGGDTYCCPNNYRRIMAELPGFIYYLSGDGIAVNLYTDSSASLHTREGVHVHLEQSSDYPRKGCVSLRITPRIPAVFTVKLRAPGWARGLRVSVNGAPFAGRILPGSFINIRRKWSGGDCVELSMSMPWRLIKGRVNQAGRAAVMRGPLVYCLGMALNPELEGSDLRDIVIDPSSECFLPDDAREEDGSVCRVRAWADGEQYPAAPPKASLSLTRFTDPDGRIVYLRLPDPASGEDDGLFLPGTKKS